MQTAEKTYAPRPAEHPVEVDLSHVSPEKRGEVKGLILKNHLPSCPFGIKFPEDITIKVTDIEVIESDFRVFVEVEKEGKKIDISSPWVYLDVQLTAPNGTWDKETETENEEVDYKRAFENLVIPKLKHLL